MRIAAWSLLPFGIIQWYAPAVLIIALTALVRQFLLAPMRPMPMRAALHHARKFS
jgi:hypothetical protein